MLISNTNIRIKDMKNLIKYFTMGCFAAGTLLCTSCEDFLDRQGVQQALKALGIA